MKEKLQRMLGNRRTPLFLAFFIPFVITLGICIGRGIYPFGSQCFLHIDMYHQYAPFMTEFMNKLKEGGSLIYSWNLGLGTDFVSLMAYYLSSPMNWLVALCPSAYVIEFMTVLILIKIGLSGYTFAFYLNRHYGDKGYKTVLFAVFYALSGFICAYNWDIMWLDTVWLAPLIILGLERLVKEGKCSLYFVTLAVSILSNYYISIMVCIYLVVYFVILLFEQKGGRIKAALRFGLYSALAGGCGMVLILPEIALLSASGSGGISFPDKVEWYFNALDELARACIGVEVASTEGNWPNLYCGAAVLLLFFLYILNRKISWKRKVPRVLFAAFFLVSFANNQLNFIWHGLHFPDGLPARQTFLFAFLLLGIGYETVHHRRGIRMWHIIAAAICAETLLFACFLFTDTSLVEPQSMLLTGIVIIGYAMIIALYCGRDKKMKRLAAVFAFLLVCVEAAVNMDMTSVMTTGRISYMAKQDEYQKLTKEIQKQDDSFYRIDKFKRLTKNESALSDYPSASIFSSLINVDVADFYREMGMEGGKNYYCYNGATMLTASMLNVKYLMTDSQYEESPYRTLVNSDNGVCLYRNNYTLPLGFMMDSDLEEQWDYIQGTPVTAQNNLGFALGADEALLQEMNTDVQMGHTTIHVEQSGYVYGYYTSKEADTITATAGTRVRKFSKCAHVYLLDLGYCEEGTDISLTADGAGLLQIQGYMLNEQAFETVYEQLNAQTMELASCSDTKICGQIEVKKAGSLFLSVPDDEGWKTYVDGKKTEYQHFGDAFISIPLEEGNHTIELVYTTPNLKTGILISAVSLGVFLLSVIYSRRKNGKRGKSID